MENGKMPTYKDFRLMEDARKLLKAEFEKTAALRATKLELETKLTELKNQLGNTAEVDTVLADTRFKALETLVKDKDFLADIEQEVAREHHEKTISKPTRKKSAARASRKRMTTSEKQAFLRTWVQGQIKNQSPITVAELGAALKKAEQSGQGGAWLKSLNLPKSALKSLGSKRDGTLIVYENIDFLKDLAPTKKPKS